MKRPSISLGIGRYRRLLTLSLVNQRPIVSLSGFPPDLCGLFYFEHAPTVPCLEGEWSCAFLSLFLSPLLPSTIFASLLPSWSSSPQLPPSEADHAPQYQEVRTQQQEEEEEEKIHLVSLPLLLSSFLLLLLLLFLTHKTLLCLLSLPFTLRSSVTVIILLPSASCASDSS